MSNCTAKGNGTLCFVSAARLEGHLRASAPNNRTRRDSRCFVGLLAPCSAWVRFPILLKFASRDTVVLKERRAQCDQWSDF